jgi:hypothetical protein
MPGLLRQDPEQREALLYSRNLHDGRQKRCDAEGRAGCQILSKGDGNTKSPFRNNLFIEKFEIYPDSDSLSLSFLELPVF